MNLKTWIPLVLAIALGLLAMKIASNVMSKNNPSVSDAGSKSIVVFKHDVTPGSKLTAEDLETAKIAGDINTQAVFNKPADLDGRVMFTAATKGTPVIDSMLTPVGTGGGLQALVPKGKRAITVEINEFTGIAGNLVPGCRVDVVSTINGENGEQVSRTVVQNVVVQSMGMRQAQ
ncbi:MAG TPA: Flp pilus assembly protein CpaB, partial [Tepidisphaeraceae bacterium]|nr:Flp pilus assembly protein CpaB [Tepidisphaeraceae bacterium]